MKHDSIFTLATLGTLVSALTLTLTAPGTAIAGSCNAASSASHEAAPRHQPASYSEAEGDIVDLALGAGNFRTLTAALVAADLVDVLRGEGPFTVFAPTDEAFAKLPKGTLESLLLPKNRDQLVAILTYHVVPGSLDAEEVANRRRIGTVNGKNIEVEERGTSVLLDDAKVVRANLMATNGVVHVVDSVLLPR